MTASLDWAGVFTPPRHRRPDNTSPDRLAALAEGVLLERADRLHGRPVDDRVVFDLLTALLAVLFPEQYAAPDPDADDLPVAPQTDTQRQAIADGATERDRREKVARENGLPDGHAAGLVPRDGSVERVNAAHLQALIDRLRRRPQHPAERGRRAT